MSIADFIADDPFGAAELMGLPGGTFIPGFSDFEDDEEGAETDPEDFQRCKNLSDAEAFPCLILDDADTYEFSTPALMGKEDTITRTAADQSVQEFWKKRGAMRIEINSNFDTLLPKLIKSKIFTSIVVSGSFYSQNAAKKKKFMEEVVPLMRRFVQAGGVLIIQDGQRWSTYKDVFSEDIKWERGDQDAGGFGVHEANRERVKHLFPKTAADGHERAIRGQSMTFYVKGALLKNVPDDEACFSSVEKGYAAAENVVVACKTVDKGKICYIGTYNMCDSSDLIRDFLKQNALSREQFQRNCSDAGLWSDEAEIKREDFGGVDTDSDEDEDEHAATDQQDGEDDEDRPSKRCKKSECGL
eukprot:TRINITY_DN66394_c0_g1_i1.p1 TRINITY_DN66394_c0_g1~~TRINITY_DN66394_c0_g1_i1.p1  ORF type:complete len:358 (+),score=83.06 TRINITY_DN66394_c0_g1_i1:49-1122(+)